MKPITPEEQRGLILGIFEDFADDADDLVKYITHVGIDISALSKTRDLPDLILAHYRIKRGCFDVDRATKDLLTWPPIARAVFEGQERKAKGLLE